MIPHPESVRGEDFWIDELEYQLGRPLTPTGRDYLRTWLRAFAAHVNRQALRRGDEPSSLPMSGQPGDASRNASKIPEGTAEATPAPRLVTADDPLCPGDCIGNYADGVHGGRYPCEHNPNRAAVLRVHPDAETHDEDTAPAPAEGGAPPPLLQRAMNDRDAHPWRYYRLDHDTMKRLLDEMAAKLEAATSLPVPSVSGGGRVG